MKLFWLLSIVSAFVLTGTVALAADAPRAESQSGTPPETLGVYLDAFHFQSGNMQMQMEIHHYCAQLNEDLIQCVLYDGTGRDALLMGVEYVISEKLFKTLPKDEKRMWHSHAYEVKSGQLITPSLPEEAEHGLMEKLVSTYGKTWHTWDTDKYGKNLPLGIPILMMAFTADGQIDPAMLARRDKRLTVSTESKKKSRADIPAHSIQPGADAWQSGEVAQLELKTLQGKGKKDLSKASIKKQAGKP
jgi:hypothetical protein